MSAEAKSRYFQELTLNLQHEGFVVKPETEEGLLPVELDGQRLCLALDTGAVRYWREDAADDYRNAALDKAISITKTTAEYMRQMETAPRRRHRQLHCRQAVLSNPQCPERGCSYIDFKQPGPVMYIAGPGCFGGENADRSDCRGWPRRPAKSGKKQALTFLF